MENNSPDNLNWDAVGGRIVALEIFMECVLNRQIVEQSYMKPSEYIDGSEAQLIFSIQDMERPLDDQTDRIFGHAADAIKELFDQMRIKIDGKE